MSNLLPLETFRDIFGFHPAHFWGVAGTGDLAVTTNCDTLVRQYPWQNSDAASRSDIVRAIEIAEARLHDYLGYWPAPTYVTETHPWPAGAAAWGRWWNIQLDNGYVQAAGVETLTAIQANTAVVYSDSDGDGIDDLFTLGPVATTVTDVTQIAVYISAADRFANAIDSTDAGPRWRVQPVQVTISGGNVTIRGPKWLCVKPIKYEGIANVGANGLDPAMAANFVTTLDIYRRWTSPDGTTTETSQGVIEWETRPCHGWWCSCDTCSSLSSTAFAGSPYDPAATARAVARVGIRDAEHGIVSLGEATYDSTTGVWSSLSWTVCDTPDRASVRVLAGYPLSRDGQMDRTWQVIVARLAAAELARPICGCADANRELYRWQFDVARTGASDEVFGAISPEDLRNPLGTRRGHIYAWRAIQHPEQLRGFLA